MFCCRSESAEAAAPGVSHAYTLNVLCMISLSVGASVSARRYRFLRVICTVLKAKAAVQLIGNLLEAVGTVSSAMSSVEQ